MPMHGEENNKNGTQIIDETNKNINVDNAKIINAMLIEAIPRFLNFKALIYNPLKLFQNLKLYNLWCYLVIIDDLNEPFKILI